MSARPGAALGSLLTLGGCGGVLDPAGPIAASNKTILLNSFGIMMAIVVPTIGATLWAAFWYRAGNARAEYRPEWEYSSKIEMVVWSIPTMTVLLLAGLTWIGAHALDPRQPIDGTAAPVKVEVVALDWKWLFIYPGQGIASVNHLVVPVGTAINFTVTSTSVMNSFFIPRLGSQIYAMAGMTTHLNLRADQPGSYQGISAQFSGAGFPGMRFVLDAVPAGDFARWVAAAREAGPALDAEGFDRLAIPSANVAPATWRDVAPSLFGAILAAEGHRLTDAPAAPSRGP